VIATGVIDRDALEAKLSAFHAVNIPSVLEVIAYLRDESDAVIAGGSLAIGLGNRRSDLDIVIVGERTIESSRLPLEHFLGSLRIDVWVMAQQLIDEVFARARQGLNEARPLQDQFADSDHEIDLKLLHRIAFGIWLDGRERDPDGRCERAQIARDTVIRACLERMRQHAFFAKLTLARDDSRRAAAINARNMVEDAMQAVITDLGKPFSGRKWLRQRLTEEVPHLDDIYRPFAVLPRSASHHREFVGEATRCCETLTGIGLGMDQLTQASIWVNRDLQHLKVGSTFLLLSPDTGTLWELDRSESEAWEALAFSNDGTADGMLSRPCSGLTETQAALCIDLCEQGLLALMWSEGVPLERSLLRSGNPT
jgi:hypothetical protein